MWVIKKMTGTLSRLVHRFCSAIKVAVMTFSTGQVVLTVMAAIQVEGMMSGML